MAYSIVTGSPAQPVFLVDPNTGLPYVAGGGSGSLPVTIADGADVAEGATTATAYSDATGAAAGTVVGLLKGNYVTSAAFSAKLPASLGPKTGATSLSVVSASDGFKVRPITETTATVSAVASANADTALLVTNTGRLPGSSIVNDSTAILYILLGSGAASTTNYSYALAAKSTVGAALILPDGWTGPVRGFWSAANGFAYVTELSA